MYSSVQDLFCHQAISSLVAGPAGWAFQVKQAREQQDDYSSVIWWVDTDKHARCLTSEDAYSSGPRWSPDGKQLAFIRTAGDLPQVFSIPLDGGEAQQVTTLEHAVVSIEDWDSERQKLLLCVKQRQSSSEQQPHVIEFLPFKQDGSGITVEETVYLYQADAVSGQTEPLVETGGDVQRAVWSPDRQRIAFLQRRTGSQRHRTDVWLKDGQDEPRQLTQGLASVNELVWSPDGNWIVVSGAEEEGTSMSWPYRVDAHSGETRRLAQVELTVPAAIEWEPDQNRVLLLEVHKGLQRMVSVDLDGDVEVVKVLDCQQINAMAQSGKAIAIVVNDASSGPEVWVGTEARGEFEPAGGFNQWRHEREWLRIEPRCFAVPDGDGGEQSIEGWLIRPKHDHPGPLLLELHGGPHSHVLFEHETHTHWGPLVEQGWSILALNAVGSSGYGEDFAKRINGHWGERDWPQYQAARECLRQEGVVGDTVAVFGHSYGGFLAAWALSHDDSIASGVISGGVIDLQSHTGTSDTGYYVGPYSMGVELPEGGELYRRLSPITYVDRIVSPTLLLQGGKDERCPQGQAEQLFTQILRHGLARARLVLFPEGSHHLSSTGRPSDRVRFYEELIGWLEQASKQSTDKAADGADTSSGDTAGNDATGNSS